MSKELSKNASELLTKIRDKGPLVWNFSNFVSMDIAANALLSIGASPAMAHAKEEAKDFTEICKAISGALTINIGTFDPYWQECALEAVKNANENNVPWVLDPVGAGASGFRNKNVEQLINHLNKLNEKYKIFFEKKEVIKIAVNKTYSSLETKVSDNDEIAFFPPVTGG